LTAGSPAVDAAPTDRPTDRQINYSPYPGEDFPNQVFFGDTHLHTAFSADAGLAFCTLTPDDAYRFAKGETVTSSKGLPARLKRPLDFLVVADHSENLGIQLALEEESDILDYNEWSRKLAETYAPGTIEAVEESYAQWFGAVNTVGGGDPMKGSGLDKTMWARITESAERHNQPGAFTAFIGYEWTSGPDGNNLHRNIVFRDGKDLADLARLRQRRLRRRNSRRQAGHPPGACLHVTDLVYALAIPAISGTVYLSNE
jgi:hypothetical protein